MPSDLYGFAHHMKVLVLYEELAWYFINCINVLCRDHKCEVLIFCKKANPTAPFNFKYVHPSVSIIDRSSYSESELMTKAKTFSADLIFLAGWSHKPYIKMLKTLRPKYSVIGFDNQWAGSFKQRLGALYFRLLLKPFLKHAFVPGERQKQFAKRLGFKEDHIITGAYCCDYDLFHSYSVSTLAEKKHHFPKRFLFVGRYAKEKGVEDLWTAFIELCNEKKYDWELWCLGKGEIAPVKHDKIKHFGFKQPEEMMDIIKNTGIFVLPSTFEPWGVVVHEYTAAGFPVICTEKVGAADAFVRHGENGIVIKAENTGELKSALEKCITMTDAQLIKMSDESTRMASAMTPEKWAENLMRTTI
jgi:glycosyltransferase involved in cell wall biosynthesis